MRPVRHRAAPAGGIGRGGGVLPRATGGLAGLQPAGLLPAGPAAEAEGQGAGLLPVGPGPEGVGPGLAGPASPAKGPAAGGRAAHPALARVAPGAGGVGQRPGRAGPPCPAPLPAVDAAPGEGAEPPPDGPRAASGPAPRLILRLLGSMEASDAQGRSVLPRVRKTRAVLAVLALAAPQAVTRARLCTLLWPSRGQEQARASLRQAVRELHAWLLPLGGALLDSGRDRLALRGAARGAGEGEVWVDARLVLAATPARPEGLGELRGQLLADLDGLDPAFDAWLAAERAALLSAAAALAGEVAREGDPAAAVAGAERVLRLDRGFEPAWRALMQARARRDGPGAAAEVLHDCGAALAAAGLGGPSAETRGLLARLEAAPVVVAPAVPAAEERRLRLGVMPFRALDPSGGELALGLAEEITTGLSRFRWLACVSSLSLAALAGGAEAGGAGGAGVRAAWGAGGSGGGLGGGLSEVSHPGSGKGVGEPAPGHEARGRDAAGRDAAGLGAHGLEAHGSGAHGSGAHGSGAHGPGAHGDGVRGQDAAGQDAYGQGAHGQGALGPGALGPGAHGQAAAWRALKLDFLLEGSVQRSADRVRVTVRLLDLRQGGEVVWAQRFDRALTDLLALQDEVASLTVAQVDPELMQREGDRVGARMSADPTAYLMLLRAIPAMCRLEPVEFRRAGDLLAAALALDPSHASAHAWWGYWHLLLVGQGWAEDPVLAARRCWELTHRAILLDPADARALTVAGHVEAFMHHRLEAAHALHERALLANPNLPLAWGFSGLAHVYAGRHLEGLRRIEQARALSPFDPHGYLFDSGLMLCRLMLGEDAAVAQLGRRAIPLNPAFTSTRKVQLAALGHLGALEEARGMLRELLLLEPGFSVGQALQRSPLALLGDRERYVAGLRLAGLPD